MFEVPRDAVQWRRLAGRALVGGLCLAALVAVGALLTGSFDDTDWRVVATSLGFSVFTSTTAAGAALRLRDEPRARALGGATMATSVAAYVLLVAALWVEDADGLWRAFGIAGLGALWSSHASLVTRARRPADTPLLRRLTALSIVTLGIDTAVGVVALLGLLDGVDGEPFARVLGALLVITVLATALPPILRRIAAPRPGRPAAVLPDWPGAPGALAVEVAEAAERLSAMELPPQARAEVARLRDLARDAGA
jgi:hypothetical protein